ncbi:hypothetical protein [Acinetobacter sp.]|uniref:hypothetical protein n=1 Tax=Acinetobacter sp. TaxID=472 RepID=UPI003CFD57CF
MSALKVEATKLLETVNFLAPGFERTGTHIESQLLHMELVQNEDGAFMILSTSNRFVIARQAIQLSADDVAKDTKFTALINYETFRGILSLMSDKAVVSMSVINKGATLKVDADGGVYKFSIESIMFNTTQPELGTIGKMSYDTFYDMMENARIFTSTDRASLTGDSIYMSYNDESKTLSAIVYRNSVAAVIDYKIREELEEKMLPFELTLKASIFKKLAKRTGDLYLLSDAEKTAFGMTVPMGRISMSTLTGVDSSVSVITDIMGKNRPYFFELDKDRLSTVLAKISLFAGETVMVEIKDNKAVFKAVSAKGTDAVESLPCTHLGVLNLELPIRTVNNVLKLDSATGNIRFDVDEGGFSAKVSGTSDNIAHTILFSVMGDSDDDEKTQTTPTEAVADEA